MLIIEMNPRVSRSSALASKATGFPIAKIAAKLAVGLRLDEIPNDITKKTPASFEPSIDYVVVKVPKWQFEKFPGSEPVLGVQMKSIGEVMAIGSTFKHSLWKAIRSLETGRKSGTDVYIRDLIPKRLITPNPDRLNYIRFALSEGYTVDEISEMTAIDPWFLSQVKTVVDHQMDLARTSIDEVSPSQLLCAKRFGLSDNRLARLWNETETAVRNRRKALGHPRGIQARRHVCRRVRELHPVSLLGVRGRVRGRSQQLPEGNDPRVRPESHRPGHRIRLLLLPRLVRAAAAGLRVDHGQLQSRDRVDRLRHERQTLLRAPDAGERAEYL